MRRELYILLKCHRHEPDEFGLGSVLSPLANTGGPKAAEETFDATDIPNCWVPGEESHREACGSRQFGQCSGARLSVALLELAQCRCSHTARHGVNEAALGYSEVLPGQTQPLAIEERQDGPGSFSDGSHGRVQNSPYRSLPQRDGDDHDALAAYAHLVVDPWRPQPCLLAHEGSSGRRCYFRWAVRPSLPCDSSGSACAQR